MGSVVVTGGAGYIGSHICKELKKQGYVPVVIDNLSRGHREFVRWGPLIQGSIGDRELLREVFAAYHPLAVIHCAGLTYVEESTRYPDRYYQTNLAESLILLEEMVQSHVNKIIFSSTCATYGAPEITPLTETQEQKPLHPYGRSKLAIEWMIQDFAEAYPLRYAILRYFNAAGADLEGEVGEKHDPETHLIPRILEAALGHLTELEMYGHDYPTPDGTAIRDYVHVSDLARAHLLSLEYLEEHSSCVLNLGTGCGISVKEMIASAEKIVGKQIPVVFKPRRAKDPPILVADGSQAKKRLGWQPKHSEIDTLLMSALNWMRKQ